MTTPTPGKNDALSDPRVAAMWRAASQEEPPAELDITILAAARREVGAGPQRMAAREALAARRRWWPLAAAATVAAIAVGILQLTPPDQLGAPASEQTGITDMPAPDKGLGPKAAKVVPREEAQKNGVTVDRMTQREEAQKNGATVDRMTQRDEATKDSATVDGTPSRQEAAKDIATAERTAQRADTSRVPSIAPAAPVPAKPDTMARKAPPFPEPFPAASPAPNTAAGAAPSVAAAPALAGKVAAPALAGGVAASARPNEAPQVPAAAESAFAGRMTTKGEAGGSAIVLVEPSQPIAPAAAAQSVPQSAAVRPSPQVTMAKARAAEREADAERTNEMGKDRGAVARTDSARASDRSQLPVAEWIALIRRLRDEGKTAEAAKELAAFRVAHADHEKLLPRDLIDWRPPEKK